MSCNHCRNINKVIDLPSDLISAIRLVKNKLEDGSLSYLGAGFWGEPFSKIESGEGWSDIVDQYFCCVNCQQKIRLYAETYHGSGGMLEAVQEIEGELVEFPTDVEKRKS